MSRRALTSVPVLPVTAGEYALWLRIVEDPNEWFATPFVAAINAVAWARQLPGDFAELVQLLDVVDRDADRVTWDDDTFAWLRRRASAAAGLALDGLAADLRLLRDRGHAPSIELLRRYTRDDDADLPTDVHSFHIDTANAPAETVLCTYYGEPSELLPRQHALRRVEQPELRARLRERFGPGDDLAFAAWLREHAFDLHFSVREGERPVSAGLGWLWRLAVEYPGNTVAACVHRAPTTSGPRLLLIS